MTVQGESGVPVPAVPGRPGPSRRPFQARGWALRELPTPTQWLIFMVASAAAGWGLKAGWTTPLRAHDLLLFGVLLMAGAVSVEASRRVSEPVGMNAHDMLTAWWVPLTVLLPPLYALLAPAALMALTQCRVRRIATYKRVYSAAAIGLAHAAAATAFHALPERLTDWRLLTQQPVRLLLVVVAVAALAALVNTVLIGLAVKTADPEARWSGVFVVDSGTLELTELCAGVLIAVLASITPVLVVVALPPVLLLQRGMMYAQLHAAARTDTKTGLLNAVSWEREVAAALSDARRRGCVAAVLLVDIDHFKRVNDTHGHLVGDDVLRGVAQVLQAQVRDAKDLICRFGGEEFAVFLPGMGDLEAPRAAERLRRAVAELVTATAGGLVHVTISVGVAVADPLHTPDASVPELLASADLGLYQAKADGRDRVQLRTRPDRRR